MGVSAEYRVPGATLDFLLGRWRAKRIITDFRSGVAGSFSGTAEFTPAEFTPGDRGPAEAAAGGRRVAGLLVYQEQGELTFGGHRGPASRSLLFLPAADGGAEVLFADGRPFFTLDLQAGACSAEHPCGPDSYQGMVRVLGPDAYSESWRVTGPDKDYEMTTTLTRIAAAE